MGKRLVIVFGAIGVAFAVFLVFGFTYFNKVERQTVEQSIKNSDIYLQKIEKLLAPYTYDVIKQDSFILFITCDIIEGQSIEIKMWNDEADGGERFSIHYTNTDSSAKNWVDKQLFVALVNIISGKKIGDDDISKIFTVSDKPERWIGFNVCWRLCYLLYNDGDLYSEKIYFYGLTETGTRPIWRD